MAQTSDEWHLIMKLLPSGWEEAAWDCGAFKRARFTKAPADLLRLLLYHAVNDGSLRSTAAQAEAAGIASMSSVALYKRLRTSAAWLGWIAAELCREFREAPRLPDGLRLRAIDGSTLCKPGSKGTDWRLHYMLDLRTLSCDWLELTDGSKGETLARAPIGRGDVILGDRHFSRLKDLQFAASRRAHILVRIRWRHARMQTAKKRNFEVLKKARRLRVGQVKSWPVHWVTPKGTQPVSGRVVAIRLPAPVAERTKQRIRRRASRKGRNTDPRTLEAAHFVMVFTTLPESLLSDEGILDLYRFRWQIEIAFKRHKQLLRLGRLPHTNPETGRSWILAKLVVALLLEKLHRNAGRFSPWGYRLELPAS